MLTLSPLVQSPGGRFPLPLSPLLAALPCRRENEGAFLPVPRPKGVAAAGRKSDLAALKRPGDKGDDQKRTTSGKFQPQIYVKELGMQAAGPGQLRHGGGSSREVGRGQ